MVKTKIFDAKRFIFTHTFDHLHFGKFDAGGVLYHANYFHLLEELRERFLLKQNLSYAKLVEAGYQLPISKTEQHFIKPIFYGEKITGELFLNKLSRCSITFNYKLKNEKSLLLHEASTTLAVVKKEMDQFKLVLIPENLKKILLDLK